MVATWQRQEPNPVMIPVALGTAAAQGDLVAVVSDLAVPAGSFTWDTDETTTRRAFVAAFAGVSAQDKAAAGYVYGNGGANQLKLRTDTGGVHRFAVAAGTYVVGDLLGPKKQSGNLLESQTLQLVTDPAQATHRCVGLAGVNPGYLDCEVLSSRFNPAAQEGPILTLSFPVNLASITGTQDVVTGFTPGYAGEILSVAFLVNVPVTTAAKLATLNVEIGATDLTGGVVALTSANCTPMGAIVAGTAVTAANVFAATDTISVEASAVTAFAEGSGTVLIRVRKR